MTHQGEPVVVGPNEGATIEGPVGGPLTFTARGEQNNGTFTSLENVIPPGQGPPLHTHANEDEAWYVLEGELRFKVDDEATRRAEGLVRVRTTRHPAPIKPQRGATVTTNGKARDVSLTADVA